MSFFASLVSKGGAVNALADFNIEPESVWAIHLTPDAEAFTVNRVPSIIRLTFLLQAKTSALVEVPIIESVFTEVWFAFFVTISGVNHVLCSLWLSWSALTFKSLFIKVIALKALKERLARAISCVEIFAF